MDFFYFIITPFKKIITNANVDSKSNETLKVVTCVFTHGGHDELTRRDRRITARFFPQHVYLPN